MIKRIQFGVYFVGGLFFALVITQNMMMSIYGAPTNILQSIALFGALGLLLAAFTSILFDTAGRILALASIAALGSLYFPASQSLAPSAGFFFRMDAYVVIGSYLGLVAFSLLYPARYRFSVHTMVLALLLSSGIASHAYFDRLSSGQYDWADLVFFQLDAEGDELQIVSDPQNVVTDEILTELKNAKIVGQLNWQGAVGRSNTGNTMILIGAARNTKTHKLYYSREDIIVYYIDGDQAVTIPANMHTFNQYPIKLEPNGRVYYTTSRGGSSSARAFYWE